VGVFQGARTGQHDVQRIADSELSQALEPFLQAAAVNVLHNHLSEQ
jgi:hypothetical protein